MNGSLELRKTCPCFIVVIEYTAEHREDKNDLSVPKAGMEKSRGGVVPWLFLRSKPLIRSSQRK